MLLWFFQLSSSSSSPIGSRRPSLWRLLPAISNKAWASGSTSRIDFLPFVFKTKDNIVNLRCHYERIHFRLQDRDRFKSPQVMWFASSSQWRMYTFQVKHLRFAAIHQKTFIAAVTQNSNKIFLRWQWTISRPLRLQASQNILVNLTSASSADVNFFIKKRFECNSTFFVNNLFCFYLELCVLWTDRAHEFSMKRNKLKTNKPTHKPPLKQADQIV